MSQSSNLPWTPPQQIRVKALGLVKDGTRTFLSYGYDSVKQQSFYRALGGSVEFGETSLEALRREFQEEVQTELTNIKYLGCLENLFTYGGQPGHELIQLYQCDFADAELYHKQSILVQEDNGDPFTALWVESDRFRSGELQLVPHECLQYL
jgi:8-oxo-dGTP pyrophosphatase MutT (NUDIX family)